MAIWKRLGRQPWVQKAIGLTAAQYLRLVYRTSNVAFEPPNIYELIDSEAALDAWIAEASRAGTVAFDCETDALDANNAGLVGLSLALLEGPWGNVNSTKRRAAYVPLSHRAPGGERRAAHLANQ